MVTALIKLHVPSYRAKILIKISGYTYVNYIKLLIPRFCIIVYMHLFKRKFRKSGTTANNTTVDYN